MKEASVGVALAAMSAITFIAYKHPKAYREISWFLALVALCYGLVVCGVYAGRDGAIRRLLPLIPENKKAEVAAAFTDALPVFESLMTIALFVAFLLFLRLLPHLLAAGKKNRTD